MNRISTLLVALSLFFFSFQEICQTEFGYATVKLEGKSAYSIEMKLEKGSGAEYTFELFDLTTGTLVARKSTFMSQGESKVVFENIKSSTYTVYYSSSECPKKKSVKGKGIVLE